LVGAVAVEGVTAVKRAVLGRKERKGKKRVVIERRVSGLRHHYRRGSLLFGQRVLLMVEVRRS
jgi:hypothetical protein